MTKAKTPTNKKQESAPITESGYIVNLESWRMKDFRKFTQVAKDGDLDGMIEMVDAVTTFPDGVDSVDEMELEQWGELVELVNDRLIAKFRTKKAD